jgi:DNA helicase-2/ATP-dependent DNA helicase PcrA
VSVRITAPALTPHAHRLETSPPMDLSHLNPSQRRAVETTEGPLLVLAGAGSGKTRVVTHRIQLLLERGVPPEAIVALSFTNKAADEMRDRLRRMTSESTASRLVLGTFHSLGARLMRETPKAFGMPKRISILDQGDVFGILRTCLRELGFHAKGGERRFDLAAVAQRVGLWKNEFYGAAEVAAIGKKGSEYDEVAAAVYEAYEDRLRSMGAVDFDDLVVHVATCLRDPEIAAPYRERFRYLMVDEYQDSNHAQLAMLQGLLGPHRNLCVVGDDDQAIYGWRGAKVGNILGFDLHFPGAQVIKLEENYRSVGHVCACANAVIARNEVRHDKRLVATRPPGEKPYLVTLPDHHRETRWVGSKILQLIRHEGIPAHDIAVLYRSTRLGEAVEDELAEHGIAYRMLGGQSTYDRKEVKDALAWLRVLVTPWDEVSVRRALESPPRGIGRTTLDRLHEWASEHQTHLVDAMRRRDEIEGVTGRPAKAIEGFLEVVDSTTARAHARRSWVDALRVLLDELGTRQRILEDTGSQNATTQRWAGVTSMMSMLERFEERLGEDGLAFGSDGYRKRWREQLQALDRPKTQSEEEAAPPDAVTLATIHSAKGLEWKCVFLVGCEEGVMPHKRTEAARISDAISGDLAEERRLFYVAITRARDRLWMTRAQSRVERGREIEVQPSRFLAELPEDSVQIEEVAREAEAEAADLMALTAALLGEDVEELRNPTKGKPSATQGRR